MSNIKNNHTISFSGSVFTLPYFAILLFVLSMTSCVQNKKVAKAKANYANLQNGVKGQNGAEIKGASIDGYVLQNNDRVFFNALRSYLSNSFDTAFVSFNYYNSLDSTDATTYYYLAQIKGRYNYLKETLKDAQKSVALAPENKWMKSFYAGILAFNEQYDSAANLFLAIGRNNPGDRENSYLAASRLLQKAGKTDASIAILDTLLSYHSPNDEDILQEKQAVYLKSGKMEDALNVTRQLVAAYPLSPEYLVQMVEIYELDNDPVKSAAAVKVLEKQFPKNEDVTSYIFGYHLKKRNVDAVAEKLKDYLETAENSQEKDLSILSQIGAYMSGNRGDTSVLTYLSELTEKIVKDKPDNLTAKRLLASLDLYGGKEEQGVAMFRALIWEHPKNYVLWTPLLEHYMYAAKFDTALGVLDQMEKVFPDSIDIPFNKMLIAEWQKNHKTALKHGLTGLDLAQKQKLKDKEVLFYNSIAQYYHELGQNKASDSVYDALLVKDPENVMALNNYAYFLSERGERLDFALNLSKKTLEMDFNNSNNLDTYGWILYKMRRYEDAKFYLEKAVTVAGDQVSSVILEHLADTEFRLGNEEHALKIWQAIDEAGQGSPFLKRKIKERSIYE